MSDCPRNTDEFVPAAIAIADRSTAAGQIRVIAPGALQFCVRRAIALKRVA